jgi:phage terminase small subunit
MPKGHNVRGRDGRLLGSSGLTEKQQEYAYLRSKGIAKGEAARRAGYSQPDQEAQRLEAHPAVAAAIHKAQSSEIRDLATLGLQRLRKILEEDVETASGKDLQARVAVQLLDRAGHVAPKAGADATPGAEKPLHEMTLAELEDVAREARGRLAGLLQLGERKPAIEGVVVEVGAQDRA